MDTILSPKVMSPSSTWCFVASTGLNKAHWRKLMASNLNLSESAANVQADALAELLNNGFLRLYDGSQPFTANHPIDSQRLLAELRFGIPAFHLAEAGILT